MNKLKCICVTLLLAGLCFSSSAQTWQNFRGIRLVNTTDTIGQLPVEGSLLYAYTEHKFYGRMQFGWRELGGGGGSVTGADNGLSVSSGEVILGGNPLNQATTINGAGGAHNFTFLNINTLGLDATTLQMQADNNATLGATTVTITAADAGVFRAEDITISDDGQTRAFLANTVGIGIVSSTTPINLMHGDVMTQPANIPLKVSASDALSYGSFLSFANDGTILLGGNTSTFSTASITDGGIQIASTQLLLKTAGTNRITITNNDITDAVPHLFTSTTTRAGIRVGSFAGDPSSLANGDLWYNSTLNALRARINGATVSLGAGGGGGITNAAANTELMKSDGTNAVASGLFIPSNGNLTLGSGSIAGARTLLVESSGTSANLTIQSKGVNGSITLNQNSADASNFFILNSTANGGGINLTSNASSTTTTEMSYQNTSHNTRVNFMSNATQNIVEFASANGSAKKDILLTGTSTSGADGSDFFIFSGSASSGQQKGDITLSVNPTGTGTPGELIFVISRTNCTGAPSGAIANVSGVLNICP